MVLSLALTEIAHKSRSLIPKDILMKSSAFFPIALLTTALVLGSMSIATDALARGHGGDGHAHGGSADHSQSNSNSAARSHGGSTPTSRMGTKAFPPGSGAGADALNDWAPIW